MIGSEGMAVFDDVEPWERKLVLFPYRVAWAADDAVLDRGEGTPVALEPAEPLRAECTHFLDCIRQGARPATDGAEALGHWMSSSARARPCRPSATRTCVRLRARPGGPARGGRLRLAMPDALPFIDLGAQRRRLGAAIDAAIRASSTRRLHPRAGGRRARARARRFCGADARRRPAPTAPTRCCWSLMATGIGPGDAVFVPELHLRGDRRGRGLVGATPVFVDIDADTFNLDLASLERGDRDGDAACGLNPRRRSFRSTCSASRPTTRHRADRRSARACWCSRTPRRASARPRRTARSARSATSTAHQLLPGQAARLLRRRRRDVHRRRRAAAHAALAARPREGRRQIRQRPHRHERPARHASRRRS